MSTEATSATSHPTDTGAQPGTQSGTQSGLQPDTTRSGPRLGVCFIPTLAPDRLVPMARVAEDVGLDDLWVWEDCFKESGVASAAIALASTERITVGIGLLPVPLRNVALTAMEFATLAGVFPGRLIAGVGHGVQSWMAQVGAKPGSPLTLLEEQTTALHRLLGGETVSTQGRYVQLDEVALDWPPATVPPLMVGGEGPRSLALAARIGDGNLLSGTQSYADIERAVQLIREHAPSGAAQPVVTSLIIATGPDAQQRADAEIERWGKSPEPGRAVGGDASEVARAIRRLADSGVTTVIAQPTQDEPDLTGLIRFVGSEVAPLLRTPGI